MKLPKLKTNEDASKFVGLGSLSIVGDVPDHQILRLIAEVNVQRKATGLPTFQVPGL
jgi:hypothetical protein